VFVRPSYDERETLAAVGSTEEFPDAGGIGFSLMVHSMQDPSLAPEGKSCLDVLVPGVPYGFMDRWGVEPGGEKGRRYQHLKENYAEVVVDAVRRAFPGLVDRVQAYDLTTPVTYELYTMATDGCWFDCAQVPGAALSKRPGPETPVGGLYLTGSKSVMGGGIYASVMNGLLAADAVLGGKLDNLFAR
jgi:phytoene dehydrogenase-like protein